MTSEVRATVARVLAEHPVSVGFLFGSHARGEATDRSDVDVAVAFTGATPADPAENDQLFGLSADLARALGTDDVDVIRPSHGSTRTRASGLRDR